MALSNVELEKAAGDFFATDLSSLPPELAGAVTSTVERQAQEVELSNQGVALTKEEGAGVEGLERTQIALRRGENLNRYLDETFGPQNHRLAEDGSLILRNSSGKEFLADEVGITKQDLQDFVEMGGPLLGGAAITAAAPATAGVAALSFLGALGGMGGGSIQDALTTSGVGVGFWDRAGEILQERGPEAALDFASGILFGKLGRAFGREKVPDEVVDGSSNISTSAVSNAEGRLNARYGKSEGSILSAAELTRAPTLSRIESIAKKIPYASELFRDLQARKTAYLENIQTLNTEGAEGASSEAVAALQRQRDEIAILEQQVSKSVDDGIQQELTAIGDAFSPNGASLSIEAAGRLRRNAVVRARDSWKARTDTLYAAFDKLGGNKLEIVNTKPLKKLKEDIERQLPKLKPQAPDQVSGETDILPEIDLGDIPAEFAGDIVKTKIDGKVAKEFIPQEVRAYLTNLANLETKLTIPQIRQMRSTVNDSIDQGEAIPGAGTFYLRKISRTLSNMMDAALGSIEDPTMRRVYAEATTAYKSGVDEFQARGIADVFAGETSPAYVANAVLGRRALSEAGSEELQRSWKFMSQRERDAFSRSTYNDLLDRATSVIDNKSVNVSNLVGLIDALPTKQTKLLFGNKLAPIVNVLKLAKAKGLKEVALQDIQGILSGEATTGAKSIATQIRTAARLQEKRVREYQQTVIGKFLKDEIRPEALNPDEFIPYMMDHANLKETQQILGKLGTDSPLTRRVKRGIVQELMHRSRQPAGSEDVIHNLVDKDQIVLSGRKLLNSIGDIGSEKLTALLGGQVMRDIKDIGIIRGAQEAVKDVSSAGGLIAGTLIPKLMEFKPGAWASLAYYRVMSVFLTNPVNMKFVHSVAKIDRPVVGGRATQAMRSLKRGVPGLTGQFFDDLAEEFSDEPQAFEIIRATLSGEEPKIEPLSASPKVRSQQELEQAAADYLKGPP